MRQAFKLNPTRFDRVESGKRRINIVKTGYLRGCAAFLSLAFLFGCGGGVKQQGDLPVIDLSLDYPKKDLSFQDIGGEMEYLPLETTDDVLLEAAAKIAYISGEKIIVTNPLKGNIFTFGRNGKILSHFNRRGQGPEEYEYIRHLIYDDNGKEFFADAYNRMLVYSEDGKYKRSFPLPEKTGFSKLSNFDDETLLGYDEYDILGSEYRARPYLFISKKDGSIVSALDLNLPQRYSNQVVVETADNEPGKKATGLIFALHITNNWNSGKNFVIADISSDTVYRLTQDKKLIPLIARIPSVHNDRIKTFLAVVMTSEKFMLLSKTVVDPEKIKNGEQVSVSHLMYNSEDKQISETRLSDADCAECRHRFEDVTTVENSAAALLSVYDILQQHEKGNLRGELEQIAETLDAEDNPVLQIIKFK